jgi:hypothetical protein
MKKNYFVGRLALLVFMVNFASCKKDLDNVSDQSSINKNQETELQDWYKSTKNGEEVEWNKVTYNQQKEEYILPLKVVVQNNNYNISKKIVVKKENTTFSGTIKYDLQKKENASPKIDFISLDLDMQNNLLHSSTKSDNSASARENTAIRLENTKVSQNRISAGWANSSNVSCGQIVYNLIITYGLESGEIYNIEIVGIVIGLCNIFENSGGGGGSGTPQNNTCANEAVAFLSMGSVQSGPVLETTVSNNGTIWVKDYNWKIYSAGTWGLLSYERGTLEKVTYPNNYNRWEFQSVAHVGVLSAGMSPGGSRTFTSLPPSYNISGTRLAVYEHIDFSVTSTTICNNPVLAPVTNVFGANTVLRSPSTITVN